MTDSAAGKPHYQRPGWFTRNVFNRATAFLTRSGVSVLGSRVLEVPGRRSGSPRRVPVNLLEHEGRAYLVAARGRTEWVRNVRANDGRLDLLLGRHRTAYRSVEVPAGARAAVLRAYLKRWKFEVGAFFEGVDDRSTDADLEEAGVRHPVFRLEPVPLPEPGPVP